MLLVEAGAQVAGIVVQEDLFNPNWPRMKLTALRSVKITGSPRPGDALRIEAVITGRLGVLVQADVSASLAGQKVLEAELTLEQDRRQLESTPPPTHPPPPPTPNTHPHPP